MDLGLGLARMGPLGLVLSITITIGCGYTSEYVAPMDGRPRAVWSGNRVVLERAGAPLSDACASALLEHTSTNKLREAQESRYVRVPSEGYWVPRYYGPPIVVVTPGIAPIWPRPPVFLPSLALASALPRPGIGSVGGLPVPALRLGSGSGSGDLGKGLVVLAVIALVVLPAVDIGLAAAPAESPTRSAEAIDQVNALNDLMRSPGSPCAYPELAGGTP